MRASAQILRKRLFVFVNLKSFLSQGELSKLYEFAFYEKLNLLLIEGISRDKLDGERIVIIDDQLCHIILN